jgi:hypothetical protein
MIWAIILATLAVVLAIGGMQTKQDRTNQLTEESIQLLLGPHLAAQRRAKQRSDKFWFGVGHVIGWGIAVIGVMVLLSSRP